MAEKKTKVQRLTIEQTADILGVTQPTLRARLRKAGKKYLNYKKVDTRYIVLKDKLFEARLTEEKELPKQYPTKQNQSLLARVKKLEDDYKTLFTELERLKKNKN